jgi:branched-chain amino acid transport system substrate-binding protein
MLRDATSAGGTRKGSGMRRGLRVAAVLSAVAVVAVGCGSSKKSASTATTAASSAAAAGSSTTVAATGPDIVVEGIAAKSAHPGSDVGFNARITRFNNAGGIEGRKIKFLGVQDDGADPAKDLTEVQSIVEKDHVFAVAPVASTTFLAPSGDFLVQNKVPVLGYGSVPSFCFSEWAFGYVGCQQNPKVNTTQGPEMVAAATGMKISDMKVAIEGLSLQAAVVANEDASGTFSKLGATVVYDKNEVPLSGQGVDFTPFVQGIIGSKANVVFEVTDLPNSVALAGALKAAGFKGVIFNGTGYLPSQLATQTNLAAALDGTYTIVQAPAQEDQSPAIKQMEADLKAINAPTSIDLGTAIGYWTADMFIQMLKATAAKGPITQQSFHDVVNAGVTLNPEMKGSNGPLIFPDYESKPIPCASFVQAQGTKYVSKVSYTCYEDINLP